MQRQNTGQRIYEKNWRRKMPYEFTGCLAHIDLTYTSSSLKIIRISGILEHVEACQTKVMV